MIMHDDKYEPEAGLAAGFWGGLLSGGLLLSFLWLACTLLGGCVTRYVGDTTGPYSTSHTSREMYGPVALGSDSVESSREALRACLEDRLMVARARTELDAARMEAFRGSFIGYLPAYGMNPAAFTDDHLLCLSAVSGYDPAYAAGVARSMAYGSGFGAYRSWGMGGGRMGAWGVR